MKLFRLFIISLLLACVNLVYGQDVSIPIGFSGSSGGGSSNILMVQNVSCNNGTSGTSYQCITATSSTSFTVGTGSKTFTVTTPLGLLTQVNGRMRAFSLANSANFMEGVVTGNSVTTITINVDTTGGSGTHTDWQIGTAALGTGQFALFLEQDADNPAAPSTAPNCNGSGGTPTQDGTFPSSAHGRMSVYSLANVTGGGAVCTFTPTSGHSSGNVRVYSGMKTSSALDVSPISNTLSSSTLLITPLVQLAQNDLAVQTCWTGTTTNSHFTLNDNWSNGIDFAQPNDATDSFAADISNALATQILGSMNGDSHNYLCVIAAYKSAVGGSFSGQNVSLFASMTGTNGGAVTVTNFPIVSTQGTLTMAAAGDPNHCFSFSNTGGLGAQTTNYTNGEAFTGAGTNTILYNLACNTGTDNTILIPLGAAGTKVSVGQMFNFPNTGGTGHVYNNGGFISATSTDRCYPYINTNDSGVHYDLEMETALGDQTTGIDITTYVTNNNPFWVTWQFETDTSATACGASTPCCQMAVYDPTTKAQVGSTITHSVQTGQPISFTVGRFDTGASSGSMAYGRLAIDQKNGLFPILP